MTTPVLDYVTVAALLPETSQVHLIRIAKQTFLTRGSELPLITSLGLPVQLHVLRANGVNTAVTIFDNQNRSLAPLVVEFPIERFGKFREMAYYTSAHPALLSTDLTKAGQLYVNSMVELAAKRLRDKGVPIAQNLVDIAKRLCIVEHIDHDRFRNETRVALFDEIYSLYALNELDTTNVAPMAQVLSDAEPSATLRDDNVRPPLGNIPALANAPLTGVGYFKVPKVIER